MTHQIPNLVQKTNILGDFHIHTNYNLEPSHDLGTNSLEEILDTAEAMEYEYVGISDHNPSTGNHTEKQIIEILKKRKSYYEQHFYSWKKKNKKNIHIFIMLEIDILPNGKLAIPTKAFEYIDAAIISVHSSFQQTRGDMTNRIKSALICHPKIKILGHPTGRLLGKREGYEVDWPEIFDLCAKQNIAIEINAHPYRLDLPDALVQTAKKNKVLFAINTDSHDKESMNFMSYGVDVARRGWLTKDDIINTMQYNKLREWLMGK